MKKLFCLTCILVCGYWGYSRLVDNVFVSDFYLKNWPETLEPSMPTEVISILQQPFYYLGKGRQFFVFESADHKWVLKFIKCQRLQKWSDQFFPDKKAQRAKKVNDLFASIALAAGPLADLTGVLYAHIQKGKNFHMPVTLYNGGFSHSLNIKEVPFVLQRKAEHVRKVLEKEPSRFNELVLLFKTLADRGIVDIDDGSVTRNNIGFLPDRAIFVDIGTFRVDPNATNRLSRDLQRLDELTF